MKNAKILKPKFLTVILVFVFVFNLFSTKILPKNLFLIYAADIDAYELVNLANSERTSRGLDALTIDSRLVSAARAKGEDMLEKDYWSHYGPNGETPWQFIIAAGYDYVYAGENLAKDFSSTVPVHNAWMASPSHKSNIINENFENIGIAVVTGEFQGSETTIVVQMFGSLNLEYSEYSEGVDESELPITGGEQVLSAPSIEEPKDGDILNEGIFTIRGTANEGSEVHIFDNFEVLGRTIISQSKFSYSNTESFEEGGHLLYAKATNENGDESDASNYVNVTVDTIPPNILEESAQIDYVEIGEGFKNYVFSVKIEDNPIEVSGEYRGKEIVFSKNEDERWEGVINETEDTFHSLTLSAVDAAGNKASVFFESGDILGMSKGVENGLYSDNGKGFFGNLISRIFTRSLRGQINFIITFLMVVLLSVQYFVLAKTGLTKENASSLLHLPVFAILLLVGLLGSGGEIL